MDAEIIKLEKNFCFLYIKNLMSLNELQEVWEEINFLSYRNKLESDTKTAKSSSGELKSNKVGIWIDQLYTQRKYSNYFKYYKKWLIEEIGIKLLESSIAWRGLLHSRHDATLFSYYEDCTYYDEHEDSSRFTQLFWTFKQPKMFEGGQLEFTDFNYQIEIENNTLVVFPSWFRHRVLPVSLKEKTPEDSDQFYCNGRYVFTTFYN